MISSCFSPSNVSGQREVRLFGLRWSFPIRSLWLGLICAVCALWLLQSLGYLGAGQPELLLVMLLLTLAYLSSGVEEQQFMLRDRARGKPEIACTTTAAAFADDQVFRQVFDQAAGMGLLAPEGQWLKVNPSLCTILGYSEKELLETSFPDIGHPDDVGATLVQIEKLFSNKISSHQTEQRFIHKLGHSVWALLNISAVRSGECTPSYLVLQLQDITERKNEEQRLIHNVFHDALTGLPNRTLFMDRLRLAVERARRRKDQVFAVLFLDLDGFKAINDSMGHIIGDQLLIQISRRLNACLRATDTVARLGGDEFTILLEDLTDECECIRIVERLQRELALPFKLGASEVQITASIGVVSSNRTYERAEDILRDADTAMYSAKSSGKACYQLIDRKQNTSPLDVANLGEDLDYAVERDELVLHYQPIVSLQTGKLFAFEALVRWQHPKRGLILPTDFIPLAEQRGSILEIGTWTIREACLQLKRWQDRFSSYPTLAVTVNLSSKQFMQPNLIDQVIEILQDTGVDPRALKLEITEGVVMENIGTSTVLLQQLRALGIELGVDDFGTGYSSLSYLHCLPISSLKIDKSFVKGMIEKREYAEIVKTVLALARTLGIRVVAEGVETLEQLVELRRLKCDAAQGFLFSKPAKVETAETLLQFKSQWQTTIAALDLHGEFEAPPAAGYGITRPPSHRALLKAV